MDEWRKEALSPPTDKSRRGVPPGEVQPFAFTVNSVFAPSLPAIAFDSGGSRTMGVPPGVVAFAVRVRVRDRGGSGGRIVRRGSRSSRHRGVARRELSLMELRRM